MYFIGIGTATPAWRYTQQECLAAFQQSPQFPALKPKARALLETVLTGNSGIASRYLALADFREAFDLRPDVLYARFAKHAPALALDAARRAIEDAGLRAEDLDGVLVSTCTGYLCPGLTSYLIEQLGLPGDVLALDLVGLGCGAAVPNLRTAEALLAAGRARRLLSVCAEVCSAAFFLDDDPGVLVSACLFGDGASAAVVSARPEPRADRAQVAWVAAGTRTRAEHRDLLRFEQRGGMLRNLLSKEVPRLAASEAEHVMEEVLRANGRNRAEIANWLFHGGGRNVLAALQQRLGFVNGELRWSREILRDYGNMSSPSVMFALEAALRNHAPGGWWWMSSFGAGFSCHGALLRVDW